MKVFVLAVVAALYLADVTAGEACKSGFFMAGNQCVFLEKNLKSEADARKNCALKGAKLAVVYSKQDDDLLKEAMRNANVGNAWISYTDKRTEGKFQNGDSLYTNWNVGQPDNWKNSEDSVVLLSNGKYNDDNVERQLNFVCQIYGTKEGWTKFGVKSLKLFTVKKNYAAAQAHCVSQGGTLVQIESAQENAVVRALDKTGSILRIGLNDIDSEGDFVFAKPYVSWSAGQPDDWKTNEDCTEIRSNDPWNDKRCDDTLASFCAYSNM